MTEDQASQAHRLAASFDALLVGPAYLPGRATIAAAASLLRELAGPPPFDGSGEYTVEVSYRDVDGNWRPIDCWGGCAVSRADARRRALDKVADDRVHAWKAEVLRVTPDDDDDDEEGPYCVDCGDDEYLTRGPRHANGVEYTCRQCGRRSIWAEPKQEE